MRSTLASASSGLDARLREFIALARSLDGAPRRDGPRFCRALFRAFGQPGWREAGASIELAPGGREGESPRLELRWGATLLLLLWPRGSRLAARDGWAREAWLQIVPRRPRYVVLSEFETLRIFAFDRQLDEPCEQLRIDIDARSTLAAALRFLDPDGLEPRFRGCHVAVTRAAAERVGALLQSLLDRGVERSIARRVTLARAVSLAAGDGARGLLGGPAGGAPIPLHAGELALLERAAELDWRGVQPAIFGAIFERGLARGRRHARGAHFTSAADIYRVVHPTITRPWERRVRAARGVAELLALRAALGRFRVLDPACGSGNFLYLAFRELRRLERGIIDRLRALDVAVDETPRVRARQLLGIEIDPDAAALARFTLQLASARDPVRGADGASDSIEVGDALLRAWPACDAIIGNPPFQSKNKIQRELGVGYVARLRARYPEIPARADYCVYWFRRAHDHLRQGQRAGLVGTNTIRQTYSRRGGLDYIVGRGGTITEAVASQVWSGDAVVHVSIVNWLKGQEDEERTIYLQRGDAATSDWERHRVRRIGASLSPAVELVDTSALAANRAPKRCFQGQTHGHRGFLLTTAGARELVAREPAAREVLFPYLTGRDLLTATRQEPSRLVIDLQGRDDEAAVARRYPLVYARLQRAVLPDRQRAADREARRNAALTRARGGPRTRLNTHHEGFLRRWWQLSYARPQLLAALAELPRYIVCARVSRRPVFAFVDAGVRPGDSLQVFCFADDYSFGILQSSWHWAWFTARCSTLKRDPRYTSSTVFASFPWPQVRSAAVTVAVSEAAAELQALRRGLLSERVATSLRALYRRLEADDEHPLNRAQARLDEAVAAAYGAPASRPSLRFLRELNASLAARERAGLSVVKPGAPSS